MGPGILGLNKYLISFSISRFLRKKSFFLGSQRFRSVKTNQRRVAACAYRGFSFSFFFCGTVFLALFLFLSLEASLLILLTQIRFREKFGRREIVIFRKPTRSFLCDGDLL